MPNHEVKPDLEKSTLPLPLAGGALVAILIGLYSIATWIPEHLVGTKDLDTVESRLNKIVEWVRLEDGKNAEQIRIAEARLQANIDRNRAEAAEQHREEMAQLDIMAQDIKTIFRSLPRRASGEAGFFFQQVRGDF